MPKTRQRAERWRSYRRLRGPLAAALVGATVGLAAQAQDKLADPLLGVGGGAAGLVDTEVTNAEPAAPFLGLSSPIIVDPLFGSAGVAVPIEVPPGRRGLSPTLILRYSSAAANTNGPFGVGWGLVLGAVRRSTARGVPVDPVTGRYDDAAGFELILGGRRILLDTCVDLQCRNWAASSEEVWLDTAFERALNKWIIRDRNGIAYTFGGTPEARTGDDVALGADFVFGWYLTEVRDPSGNTIELLYRYPIGGRQNAFAFLQRINYGGNPTVGPPTLPHIFHVDFEYDDQRPDVVPTYRGGFHEEVSATVTQVIVTADTEPDNPLRVYRFGYEHDADTGQTLLRRVSLEVPGETSPPDTEFHYQSSTHQLQSPVPLTFQGTGTPLSPLAAVQTNEVTCASCNPVSRAVRSAFVDVDGDGRRDYVNGTAGGGLPVFRNVPTSPLVPTFLSDGTLTTQVAAAADDNHLLVDMTGDGVADLITANTPGCVNPGTATTCSWDVAINVGGSLAPAVPWPGVPADLRGFIPKPLPYAGTQVAQLIDLNSDLRPDIIDCAGWTTAVPFCTFYRSNGAGFDASAPWEVPDSADANAHPGSGQSYTRTALGAFRTFVFVNVWITKRLVDMNGDGLPDLVSSESFSGSSFWDVWFNTGLGFGPAPFPWPAPSPSDIEFDAGVVEIQGSTERWMNVTIGALRDMNGDGRPDYVTARGSFALPLQSPRPGALNRVPGPWGVWFNTGAGFAASQPWGNTDGLTLADNWYGYNHTPLWTNNNNDTFDVNADGIADNVFRNRSSSSAPFSAAFGAAPRSNLLYLVQNGLGASWFVEYTPYSESNSAVPFPLWTVALLESRSGRFGQGNDVSTEFTFSGGVFDPVSHELLGFQSSTETRRLADGRLIQRSFAPVPNPPPSPGFPLRPLKLTRQQAYDGTGVLLQETQVDWGTTPVDIGRFQVHPTRRVDRSFGTNGSTQTRTHTFDTYDPFNSLRSETISGDGVTPPIVVSRDYLAQGCSGLGCLQLLCPGLPTKTVVTAGGLALSDERLGYDGCRLTSIEARLAQHNQSASTGQVLTTSLVYDRTASSPDQLAAQAGLPTAVIDPRGTQTTLQYACSNRLYPCQITRPLGRVTGVTYDMPSGRPRTITDVPNNATTTIDYDGFGRVAALSRPMDALPSRRFAYSFGSRSGTSVTPSRAETLVREPNAPSGYRTIASFYDGWGRLLGRKYEQYVGGYLATVLTDTVGFDRVGHSATLYAPFSGALPDLTQLEAPGSHTSATVLQYDVLDRIVRITNPDRTFQVFDYSSAGQVTSTDENYTKGKYPGSRVVESLDALGRTRNVLAFAKLPGQSLFQERLISETAAAYDGLGRTTSTTTSDFTNGRSATVAFQYDSLSRLTRLDDPDSGVWEYRYDNAGNLVYQNDARSPSHIEFCYDALDRVTRKVYVTGDTQSDGVLYCTPPTLSPPTPYHQYRYDSTCGANGSGRLCGVEEWHRDAVTGAEIQTSFTYDARGRVRTQTQSVSLTNLLQTNTSSQTYGYDEADRLTTVTYPTTPGGSEVFAYTYDNLGQLAILATANQTYATGLTYDLFGRLTAWQDGSGLLHSATFDPTGKRNFSLLKLAVTDPVLGGGSAKLYQRSDYSRYDAAGNVIKLKDRVRYPDSRLSTSATYQYDGLGRLTSAKRKEGTLAFAYDGLGNMTAGNQFTFEYNSTTHPHWVTGLTEAGLITHYPSGAVAYIDALDATTQDRLFTYDADGRLTRVWRTVGPTVHYVYDFRGDRVARYVEGVPLPQAFTFSFGRQFDRRGSTVTRHIYLADRRIAESPATGGGPRYPVDFVISDHLGSTLALTCYQQGASCPDRTVKRRFRYGHYGEVSTYDASGALLPVGNESTEFLYTGQRWDADAELYDFGARFYEPRLASFLTVDPIQSGLSPYGYVSSNPVNRIDPTGLFDCGFDVCFSGDFSGSSPYFTGFFFDPFTGADDPSGGTFGSGGAVFSGGYYGFSGDTASAQPPTFGEILDATQTTLGLVGFYPGAEFADFANSGISFFRGDLAGAGFSFAAGLAPIGGQYFGGLNLLRTGTAQAAKSTIRANALRGAKTEAEVAKLLEAAGIRIAGRQVSVRTSEGLRRIDILAQDTAETFFALEVKSGRGVRTVAQILKDRALATQGGVFVGRNAPEAIRRRRLAVETIEFTVP